MLRAFRAEVLKLKGANMVLWSVLTVAVVPAASAAAVKMVTAEFSVTWDAFMRMGPQMMATWWGVLLFGLAASYVFGREFIDGTAKNMLTLPVRREAFIAAKLAVLAVWVGGLAVSSVMLQAGFAAVLGLPGFAWAHVWDSMAHSLEVAGLIYLTLPVVAALATLAKGYLPPMMFSGFMATAGFMFGAVGWGRWFPWSMPFAAAGSSFGPLIGRIVLGPASLAISAAVFALGVLVVLVQTNRADNTQ
jgi:ABC-2 type transport system permease protein